MKHPPTLALHRATAAAGKHLSIPSFARGSQLSNSGSFKNASASVLANRRLETEGTIMVLLTVLRAELLVVKLNCRLKGSLNLGDTMALSRSKAAVAVLYVVFAALFSTGASGQTQYGGVNLAGAEFGAGKLPGIYNKHYTYPTEAEVDYFTGKGMNVFRLPFLWERLQPEIGAALDGAELGRIKAFVACAKARQASVILDPHNYARYRKAVIGSEELPVSAFEDFWRRVATVFRGDSSFIFGLMNEPHGMKTELWLRDANAAIAAIRSTGAKNLILVPGNAYSGAHSWNSDWYGSPNGTVMLGIVDPADNYAFEVHQYFDANSSGTSSKCVSATIGSERLKGFTQWLKAHGKRGFLGEFGVAQDETSLRALDDMLNYVDSNSDVWLGWTYWAAGPWWGNYMFSVEPRDGRDKPQMDVLVKHLEGVRATEKK